MYTGTSRTNVVSACLRQLIQAPQIQIEEMRRSILKAHRSNDIFKSVSHLRHFLSGLPFGSRSFEKSNLVSVRVSPVKRQLPIIEILSQLVLAVFNRSQQWVSTQRILDWTDRRRFSSRKLRRFSSRKFSRFSSRKFRRFSSRKFV